MNREIKFRAWNESDNEMYNLIGITPNECVIYEESDKMIAAKELFRTGIDTVKIMQYIGLEDKNGKEIYEGDIVLDSFGSKKVVEFNKIGYDGKWNGLTGFYFKGDDYDFLELRWHNDPLEIEIIGNIYENPELLKK